LQQIIYWSKIAGFKPFFKFKAPCKHSWYKAGDSWTEELGFSSAEFDTAIKKIGTKITKGMSKSQEYQGTTPQHLVIYWTDSSRISWYHLNADLLGKSIISIYLENQESEFTNKDDNPDLPSSETTTKTTTDIDFDSLQEVSENENLPTAFDGQQQAVDKANGGGKLDPVMEIIKHLRWLCAGRGAAMPKGKELIHYRKCARALLEEKINTDDWQGVCLAIDDWKEHPPSEGDKWRRDRTNEPHFALDHIANHYWRLQDPDNGKGFTPTPAAEVQARLDAGPPEDDPLGDLWAELLPQVIFQFGELRGSQLLERDNGRLKVLVKNPQAGAMDHLDRGRNVITRALGVKDIEFVREE